MCGNTLTGPHAPSLPLFCPTSTASPPTRPKRALVVFPSHLHLIPQVPDKRQGVPPTTSGVCSCLLGSQTCWLHAKVLETSTCMSVCMCPAPLSPLEHTKRHSLSLRPRWRVPACLFRSLCKHLLPMSMETGTYSAEPHWSAGPRLSSR
jgi:hypothetical protein